MRYNKYIDQNDIRECAEAGIRNAIVHNRALLGIQMDKLAKFANNWADIVVHNIPTEFVEQLTRTALVGEIIADYTNQERAKNPTDFGMLVEAINNPTSCYSSATTMSTIMSNIITELSKHCFEPDIDTYNKYRKFVYNSYHKMIMDASVPGYRLIPSDPNMLTNNIHIFTAFTSWLITKISNKVEKDQLCIDFTKAPEAMYNILKEYVSRYGWDRFIEEADNVHMYLSPAREMTRVIDRYFEDQIDSLIRSELSKILLVASNRVADDFKINGISVGVSEAVWDKILRRAGLNAGGLISGSGMIVTDVTAKTDATGSTIINTKCRLTSGLTAEISYDTQGNVLGTMIHQEPLWGQISGISINGHTYPSNNSTNITNNPARAMSNLAGNMISGSTTKADNDGYYTYAVDSGDTLGKLVNDQMNAEIDAAIAKINEDCRISNVMPRDLVDAVSTGATWDYATNVGHI